MRHHALLGVMGDALELDFLVAREDRRIHAPTMAELEIFEPVHRIDNGRHFTPSLDAPRGLIPPPPLRDLRCSSRRSLSRASPA
jgi:hypothetical protein